MNYLAHIYLSQNNPELELGNFIADSVKGNNYLNYPSTIKEGIILHRKIDAFTDTHPTVKKAKTFFYNYRHYSGVITDIVFDHFLAKNWEQFHQLPLLKFSQLFYTTLENNWAVLPKRVQLFFWNMKQENWLFMYQSIAGINDILYQMNIRTKNISKMNFAIIELLAHYNDLEILFFDFFTELENYVNSQLVFEKNS